MEFAIIWKIISSITPLNRLELTSLDRTTEKSIFPLSLIIFIFDRNLCEVDWNLFASETSRKDGNYELYCCGDGENLANKIETHSRSVLENPS